MSTLTPNAKAQLIALRANLGALLARTEIDATADAAVVEALGILSSRLEGVMDDLDLSALTEVEAALPRSAGGRSVTLPDDEGAVDADIYVGGAFVGEVTLRRPEDPRSPARLATWGEPEHWASSALLEWAGDGLASLSGPIVAAVTKALAAVEK